MSENDRDDRGHFRPEHSDGAYLRAVEEREPAGTAEIAEAVGVTRQNADRRLRRLEERGSVESKQIGNSLAWTIAEDETVLAPVDPNDPFWDRPTFDGEAMSAADADEVLY